MSVQDATVLVAGGGGFIGGHLVADLRRRGIARIRAADIKPTEQWRQRFDDVENLQLDLRERDACLRACAGVSEVYNLAADMGGMGFIEHNKARCMLSVLINTHLLLAARDAGAERFFYSSSACVYPDRRQNAPDAAPLREGEVYPAMPEDGYGWEKLFGERMCRHFTEDFGLRTHVARLHNVYGPHGSWNDGREKAPAAICRKVIEAKLSGRHEIEIWGDGTQTRTFTWIGDCIRGIELIVGHDLCEPINVGSAELVRINQLVDVVEEIAGVKLKRRYKRDAPRGVAGRSSDNTMIRQRLGWEPTTTLRDGLAPTYAWIQEQYLASR